MPADLYQVQVTRDDQPVTSISEAATVIHQLGIECDSVELDGAGGEQDGIYHVGLLGRVGDEAARGDHVWVSEGGLVVEVPQP